MPVRSFALAAIVAVALVCIAAGSAPAARPQLDPTFGQSGVAPLPINETDRVTDVAWRPDGRILVAVAAKSGDSKFVKVFSLRSDGSLDGGFGVAGSVRVRVSGYRAAFNALLAVDSRNSAYLLVSALHRSDRSLPSRTRAIVKISPRGRRVASFGYRGRTLLPRSVATAPISGKGFALGSGRPLAAFHSPAGPILVRVRTQGGLDRSFGSRGTRSVRLPATGTGWGRPAIEAGLLLMVARANSTSGGNPTDCQIAKLDLRGNMVRAFGGDGVARVGNGDKTYARCEVAEPAVGGAVLVGGGREQVFNGFVMWLSPTGVVDGGFQITNLGTNPGTVGFVWRLTDGHVFASGPGGGVPGGGLSLTGSLLRVDGTLDFGFGPGGSTTLLVDATATMLESRGERALMPVIVRESSGALTPKLIGLRAL